MCNREHEKGGCIVDTIAEDADQCIASLQNKISELTTALAKAQGDRFKTEKRLAEYEKAFLDSEKRVIAYEKQIESDAAKIKELDALVKKVYNVLKKGP
jgi:septal ring factor EnvC (AmiA/AmiB activator)